MKTNPEQPAEGEEIRTTKTEQVIPPDLIGAYLRHGYGITPKTGEHTNLIMYQTKADTPRRIILTDGRASEIDTPQEEELQKAVYFNHQFYLVKITGRKYPAKTPDLMPND